jgi:hypothetical protein
MWAITTFIQNRHVQDSPTCRQQTLRILLLAQAVIELTIALMIIFLIIKRFTKTPSNEMEKKLRYQNCIRVIKFIMISELIAMFALSVTIVIIFCMDYQEFVSYI